MSSDVPFTIVKACGLTDDPEKQSKLIVGNNTSSHFTLNSAILVTFALFFAASTVPLRLVPFIFLSTCFSAFLPSLALASYNKFYFL